MAEFTIIIPIYNVKNYLSRTVGSVINQTFREIEIILVDDGSIDGSSQMCDEFAKTDKRVQVIHKENGGLSSARNAGIMAAKSEYVMFLDGDDYLRADAIERLNEVINRYPSDFIQFQYKEVIDGQEIDDDNDTSEIFRAHTSRELFESLYKLGGVAASGATKLIKRELALEIPFEDVQHEDEMWCTRAFQNNLTVTYIPDKLYYYVMRDNSIIHSKFNRRKLDIFKVCDERIKTLKKLGLNDLLSNEYTKLFFAIVRIYSDAKNAKAISEAKEISEKFSEYKESINSFAVLGGKYKLLFKLMKLKFSFIELYRLFVNLRGR